MVGCHFMGILRRQQDSRPPQQDCGTECRPIKSTGQNPTLLPCYDPGLELPTRVAVFAAKVPNCSAAEPASFAAGPAPASPGPDMGEIPAPAGPAPAPAGPATAGEAPIRPAQPNMVHGPQLRWPSVRQGSLRCSLAPKTCLYARDLKCCFLS